MLKLTCHWNRTQNLLAVLQNMAEGNRDSIILFGDGTFMLINDSGFKCFDFLVEFSNMKEVQVV